MKTLFIVFLAVLNFSHADALFDSGTAMEECRAELVTMLPQAGTQAEKSQVLWRLARISLILGEQESTKDGKRAVFSQGVEYAQQAIDADPKNPDCYMWHSANVGRECQTHSLKDQAKAVPVMMNDLKTIIEKLGRSDYSAAWQALSEIYWNHPFKSDDDAINFTRRAVATIPSSELRLSTYISLAKMLIERNAGASKRSSAINSAAKAKSSGTIEKYSHYEGILGASYIPKWSTRPLSMLSDREEAADILRYASNLYTGAAKTTYYDKKDYKEIQDILKSL